MALRFPVEEGHVRAFARAVGAPAPSVGEIVPPTFTACSAQLDPEHMRDLQPSGPLAAATEQDSPVLQAEQHFEYLRPVRVGEVLTVSEHAGEMWRKTSRSGGQLTFTEFIKELRADDGELVVRSRMVLVVPPVENGARA